MEWPDAELAWRALSSLGPAVPALRTGDVTTIKREVLEVLENSRDGRGMYRTLSDHHFVVASKPTA
jgi:hypothetical protein